MRITVFGATGGTGTQFVHQALAAGHHVTAVVRDPSRLVLPSDPDSLEVRRAAASGQATSGQPAPGHAAPSQPASGQATSRQLASGHAAPGQATSRQAPPGPGTVASVRGSTVGVDVRGVAGPGLVAERDDAARPAPRPDAQSGEQRLTVVVADVMDPQAIEGVVAGAEAVVSAMGHRGKGPTTVCEDSIASVLRAARASGTPRIVMVSAAGMVVDGGDGPVTRYLVKPILGRVLRDAFTDMRAAEARLSDTELDWTIVRPPMLTDKPWTGTYRVSLDRNLRGGRSIARADLADYLLRAIPDGTTVRHSVAVAY